MKRFEKLLTSMGSTARTLVMAGLLILPLACQPDSSEPTAQSTDVLRVITSGGFTAAYNELAPRFEELSGIILETEFGASSGGAADSIPERLARGELFDMIILSRASLDNLTEQGFTVPESRTDLVLSQIGMAVREGSPVPDISTANNFRQVLLNAASIGYSASASGTYLSRELWPAMGVWADIEGKSRRIVSERVGAVVARGEVEIGFQQVSELLPIAGIEFVGPLPDEVQRVTTFSAAITRNANNVDQARQLIDYLASAAVAPVIQAQGLEPVVMERNR